MIRWPFSAYRRKERVVVAGCVKASVIVLVYRSVGLPACLSVLSAVYSVLRVVCLHCDRYLHPRCMHKRSSLGLRVELVSSSAGSSWLRLPCCCVVWIVFLLCLLNPTALRISFFVCFSWCFIRTQTTYCNASTMQLYRPSNLSPGKSVTKNEK